VNLYEKLREAFINGHLCPEELGIGKEYEDCDLTCKECRKIAIGKWEEYERMIENDE
jgi:hypothetical protein